MFIIEEISLDQGRKIEEIRTFLNKFNLEYESDIDYTIAVYDDLHMIATASKTKNVLKCFAIHENFQGKGITNDLIKKIEDRMFLEKLYHFFIFTPMKNKQIFTSIGYKEIITSNGISILENGNENILHFLKNQKQAHQISDKEKACIVMNGNPFTLGHRYLIEQAASENSELIVFVVSEDKSSFPFSVRYHLIKEGVKDLKNVTVLSTGPYLISNATFPTYFLKEKKEALQLQTHIDCDIFTQYYKEIFNITKRYIGNEPYCDVTRTYNEVMKKELPLHGVSIIEIDRLQQNEEVISASKVRAYLKDNDFETIKSFVPRSTYDYLRSEDAKIIIQNIRESSRRH